MFRTVDYMLKSINSLINIFLHVKKCSNCSLQSRLSKWYGFEITFGIVYIISLSFIASAYKTSVFKKINLSEMDLFISFMSHFIPEMIGSNL